MHGHSVKMTKASRLHSAMVRLRASYSPGPALPKRLVSVPLELMSARLLRVVVK